MQELTELEVKKEQKRINRYICKWKQPFHFDLWSRFDIIYKNEAKEDDDCMVPAEVYADYSRLQATITFYLSCVAKLSDERLEHTVLHELAHILLSGLSLAAHSGERSGPLACMMEEWTATRIAQILIWIHQNSEKLDNF